MNEAVSVKAPEIDFNTPQLKRHRNIRTLKDKMAKGFIAAGGVSVIVAVTLIFFYLLYEVAPIFESASVDAVASYDAPGEKGATLLLGMEEQAEKGLRLDDNGNVTFFNLKDGSVDSATRLPIPDSASLTGVNEGAPGSNTVVAGVSDGSVVIFKHTYNITWPNNVRVITPSLEFPYGESPMALDPSGAALTHVAVRDNNDYLLVVGSNESNKLFASFYEKEANFLTGDVTLEESSVTMPSVNGDIVSIQISPDTRWLYVATKSGKLDMYDISNKQSPDLIARVDAVASGSQITDMSFLLGGYSLLIANNRGEIRQWFPVRDAENQYHLQHVRSFQAGNAAIAKIAVEPRRKGFLIATAQGEAAIFNTTAERNLLQEQVVDGDVKHLAIAPRANFMLLQSQDDRLHFWSIDNEHPDVSWSALWSKVWYEGYSEPDYVWQSSAASNDFEPKYSLTPLVFGTIKAAFYAMLIAIPLAICGALYTAHFMSPTLRRKVKPAIELMEALPTVILGFLAGLFFAPFMESHMPGVFTLLVLTPIAILVFSFAWANMPQSVRLMVPEGWEPLLLLPVICFIGWLSFAISPAVEVALFDGNMPHWLKETVGLDYDQRNALVVGAAMGFAVIPTIFSITEDAVFSVPKHLTYGSLALGATPWQTMIRVVLPTASPGIFSALMIGLGRAVGETMIVLMATGNTPIMDMNIFEGMRTLAANIAVEMPESEVGSSHFRILFLAAFVLFLFTFLVNTVAEFVRQRLRAKYSVI